MNEQIMKPDFPKTKFIHQATNNQHETPGPPQTDPKMNPEELTRNLIKFIGGYGNYTFYVWKMFFMNRFLFLRIVEQAV